EARAGAARPATAGAVIESIERAVADVAAGLAAAVVTNPLHKAALTAAGFPPPGPTEVLPAPPAPPPGRPVRAVMMLAGPRLRTVPVTVHIPLRAVPAALDVR